MESTLLMIKEKPVSQEQEVPAGEPTTTIFLHESILQASPQE